METGTSTLERAFQLASSGTFPSVADIKRRLQQEGYSTEQIVGPLLVKHLEYLLAGAHERLGGPKDKTRAAVNIKPPKLGRAKRKSSPTSSPRGLRAEA